MIKILIKTKNNKNRAYRVGGPLDEHRLFPLKLNSAYEMVQNGTGLLVDIKSIPKCY